MDNFLKEYVFDKSRLEDEETGKPVFDFKLDIALRGELALCAEKGNHKIDNLLYLLTFLMSIPKELYEYSVNLAKEYFRADDVNKLSLHIVSKTPVYYLYYQKVLEDLHGMKSPKDTKKSIFCRYIEDMCNVDIDLVKNLLEYTLQSSYSYLHNIASLYLREVNIEIKRNEIREKDIKSFVNYDTKNGEDNNDEINNFDFTNLLSVISRYPIMKSPTLAEEKEDMFAKFINKYSQHDKSADDTGAAINSFADYLKSKGVNVTVTEQTLDDNGDLIDLENCECDNEDLVNKLDKINSSVKQLDIEMENALNMTNMIYEKLQDLINSEEIDDDE